MQLCTRRSQLSLCMRSLRSNLWCIAPIYSVLLVPGTVEATSVYIETLVRNCRPSHVRWSTRRKIIALPLLWRLERSGSWLQGGFLSDSCFAHCLVIGLANECAGCRAQCTMFFCVHEGLLVVSPSLAQLSVSNQALTHGTFNQSHPAH